MKPASTSLKDQPLKFLADAINSLIPEQDQKIQAAFENAEFQKNLRSIPESKEKRDIIAQTIAQININTPPETRTWGVELNFLERIISQRPDMTIAGLAEGFSALNIDRPAFNAIRNVVTDAVLNNAPADVPLADLIQREEENPRSPAQATAQQSLLTVRLRSESSQKPTATEVRTNPATDQLQELDAQLAAIKQRMAARMAAMNSPAVENIDDEIPEVPDLQIPEVPELQIPENQASAIFDFFDQQAVTKKVTATPAPQLPKDQASSASSFFDFVDRNASESNKPVIAADESEAVLEELKALRDNPASKELEAFAAALEARKASVNVAPAVVEEIIEPKATPNAPVLDPHPALRKMQEEFPKTYEKINTLVESLGGDENARTTVIEALGLTKQRTAPNGRALYSSSAPEPVNNETVAEALGLLRSDVEPGRLIGKYVPGEENDAQEMPITTGKFDHKKFLPQIPDSVASLKDNPLFADVVSSIGSELEEKKEAAEKVNKKAMKQILAERNPATAKHSDLRDQIKQLEEEKSDQTKEELQQKLQKVEATIFSYVGEQGLNGKFDKTAQARYNFRREHSTLSETKFIELLRAKKLNPLGAERQNLQEQIQKLETEEQNKQDQKSALQQDLKAVEATLVNLNEREDKAKEEMTATSPLQQHLTKMLGSFNAHGFGTQENERKAYGLCTESVPGFNAENALFFANQTRIDGLGEGPAAGYFKIAHELYEKAAEQGDPRAAVALGYIHTLGAPEMGVEPNPALGKNYFMQGGEVLSQERDALQTLDAQPTQQGEKNPSGGFLSKLLSAIAEAFSNLFGKNKNTQTNKNSEDQESQKLAALTMKDAIENSLRTPQKNNIDKNFGVDKESATVGIGSLRSMAYESAAELIVESNESLKECSENNREFLLDSKIKGFERSMGHSSNEGDTALTAIMIMCAAAKKEITPSQKEALSGFHDAIIENFKFLGEKYEPERTGKEELKAFAEALKNLSKSDVVQENPFLQDAIEKGREAFVQTTQNQDPQVLKKCWRALPTEIKAVNKALEIPGERDKSDNKALEIPGERDKSEWTKRIEQEEQQSEEKENSGESESR